MSGEPDALARDPIVVAKFWSKVRVGRDTECWEWQTRSRHEHGYGTFNPGADTGVVKAHRFAYEIANGELPIGGVVRHTCDNPPCCNPSHLVGGTQAQNVADMHERGRRKYVSRFTDEQVIEIHSRCGSGESPSNLAREFGISASYASLIANGKRRAQQLGLGSNYGR